MTANKKVICDILLEYAETDSALIVLCSDSRGSASMMPFATAYPNQFIEVGIAEQNLVSIAAGLAACGKRLLQFLLPVFSQRAVWNKQKLMLPILIQM